MKLSLWPTLGWLAVAVMKPVLFSWPNPNAVCPHYTTLHTGSQSQVLVVGRVTCVCYNFWLTWHAILPDNTFNIKFAAKNFKADAKNTYLKDFLQYLLYYELNCMQNWYKQIWTLFRDLLHFFWIYMKFSISWKLNCVIIGYNLR